MKEKERLDNLVFAKKFAPSREQAKALIMSGIVYVNGQKEDKPGTEFATVGIKVEVRGSTLRFVRRITYHTLFPDFLTSSLKLRLDKTYHASFRFKKSSCRFEYFVKRYECHVT